MRRFSVLEDLGLSVAAMTELEDGDCAQSAARVGACAALGFPLERLRTVNQVHGNAVISLDRSEVGSISGRPADGLITRDVDLALGILVADCVPVFLFDPVGRSAAIVHAGRVGTELGIAAKAVGAMASDHAAEPRHLRAVIGPSAGPCCYEVSQDMADAFAREGFPISGRNLDLWEANVQQLVGAGMLREQVLLDGTCTICSETFHSHRRVGDGGRNLAVISL